MVFTRAKRKADAPKLRPTRSQLGLVVSGLELVKTDLDATEKYQRNIIIRPVSNRENAFKRHYRQPVPKTANMALIHREKNEPLNNVQNK